MALVNKFVIVTLVSILSLGATFLYLRHSRAKALDNVFPDARSEQEWKRVLSTQAFQVLRLHHTEPAGSSALDKNRQDGEYRCAGCDRLLFSSEHKFDSGTGWPSFYQPVEIAAVGTRSDFTLLLPRTEVHCSQCGGHLGHVFKDGPQPTGLRFCINGVALEFKPSGK